MNNINFNISNLDLVQNSEEFKLILYKLSTDVYNFSRFKQPILVMASLTFLVVFLTLVYYLDSKTVKSQYKKDEHNEETDKSKSIMEKQSDAVIESNNMELILSNIKEEINELKKELEFLKRNKMNVTNTVEEDNKDVENSNNSNLDHLDRADMEKTISAMTIAEIETFLQICSNHILIPNWYTKEDFEGLTNSKLSTRTWEKILSGTEEYSSLIDETNAMTVGWFENNLSTKIEKVPYEVSVIEDSDNEESSSNEDSDNYGKTEQLDLLDNEDSDEDTTNYSDDSDNDSNDTLKRNFFIIKQLEKLKYNQLKKIAGVTNNKLTKNQLINLITQDYKKVSIIKALNFIN